MGVAYQIKGMIDKAIEHYQEALRLRPNYPVSHNNLGRAYYDMGLLDKALEHYQIALKLRPDFPEAQDNIKKILGRSNRKP
jgi:tetratricopeptide (TPR) repeat protein